MCDNLTSGLTSNLVNKMQPPNSITIARINATGTTFVKPLVLFQPLPVGPYGFIEKLWPEGVPIIKESTTGDVVANLTLMLDDYPITVPSYLDECDRYTLNDDEFKKRHIDVANRHIVIPTEALQMRSMICLMYEGGLYQKANTGSFDVLRWFMLLPSGVGPQLYPVEIQLDLNGTVSASLCTRFLHEAGYWSIEFENPEVLAKYIETYTEHVVNALEHTRTQICVPMVGSDSLNITTDNTQQTLLDKLREKFGI